MTNRLVRTGLIAAVAAASACGGPDATTSDRSRFDPSSAEYAGGAACALCHARENKLWRGSHHDLAMQEATEETVLGDFDDASFSHFGVATSFYRRDGSFFVRTDGPDGELAEFEIVYTFGVEPLQQYLIEFPDGRLQALGICWDTRPVEEGGQRWFHLYSDEPIDHTDRLHWTGLQQNWNYMCAECHSTNLRKNYDAATDTYDTTWSEIDVSCEACHGPGSAHVAWADAKERGERVDDSGDLGLAVRLRDLDEGAWVIDPETGIAERTVSRSSRAQLETCARCHSRRSAITLDHVHGRPLADTHRPALLDEDLYHADGMMLDEVYVYGSFLQSKMHAAGVTCSDCHDPHSAELARGDAEAVCARCHLSETFASRDHHFHEPGLEGAGCVDCHMAERTYMEVDPRYDHSFRIPRPDLSVEIGTPNACNDCHEDRSALWAAQAVENWYGSERNRPPDYLRALHAGRSGSVDAEPRLARAIEDLEAPALFRASAASLLGRYLSPQSLPALERALRDRDPLVRAAAVSSLEALPSKARAARGGPLLADPVRMVRASAARVLASAHETDLTPPQRDALGAALVEYRAEQLAASDRPEARANLGTLEAGLGDFERAESHFRRALEMDPLFVPGYVNLSDLHRLRRRDDLGEQVLRQGLSLAPDAAVLHHALGLVLVRRQRSSEALAAIARSVELAPEETRYAYVYGVALHSAGQTERALAVLEDAHERSPADWQVLWALATMNRDLGAVDRARVYARRLLQVSPGDPRARELAGRLSQ